MSEGVRDNGYSKVTLDLGNLNCANEPIHISLGEGVEFILRFKQTAKDGDYGKIVMERMAK